MLSLVTHIQTHAHLYREAAMVYLILNQNWHVSEYKNHNFKDYSLSIFALPFDYGNSKTITNLHAKLKYNTSMRYISKSH